MKKLISYSSCRYECIENDLLGSLQYTIHNIAPYKSKGIEKAEELIVGRSSVANSNSKFEEAAGQSTGKAV